MNSPALLQHLPPPPKKKEKKELGLVAHAYNLSYLGGRDQEDQGSKQAQANSLRDPISKIPIQKMTGGVAQGVGPEFKPQCHQKTGRKCIFSNVTVSMLPFKFLRLYKVGYKHLT
jgi:hypothetical protein